MPLEGWGLLRTRPLLRLGFRLTALPTQTSTALFAEVRQLPAPPEFVRAQSFPLSSLSRLWVCLSFRSGAWGLRAFPLPFCLQFPFYSREDGSDDDSDDDHAA